MIYRYRLRECKENEGITSHQFDGITIYKNRWLYKDRPLNLQKYTSFIEIEEANSEIDFDEKDKQYKKDHMKERRLKGKQFIKTQTQAETTTADKSIIDKSRAELLSIAKDRGFPPDEILYLKTMDLKKLLLLEEEINVE